MVVISELCVYIISMMLKFIWVLNRDFVARNELGLKIACSLYIPCFLKSFCLVGFITVVFLLLQKPLFANERLVSVDTSIKENDRYFITVVQKLLTYTVVVLVCLNAVIVKRLFEC